MTLGGGSTTIPVLDTLSKQVTIRAWIVADVLANKGRKRKAIDFVTDALNRKAISPVIDPVFGFDDMVAAHRHLESGEQFGKIVVKVADEGWRRPRIPDRSRAL